MFSLRVFVIPLFALILLSSYQPVIAQNSGGSDTAGTQVTAPDPAPEFSCGRPKLAVFSFMNPPEYANSNIGLGLSEMLVTNLAQSGRFDVIQRFDDLAFVASEIELGSEGAIEQGQETESGHIEGVDYYMTGMVTYFGYEKRGFLGMESAMVVRLDFKLFDAASGRVILAETAVGDKPERFLETSDPDWSSAEDVQRALQGKATLEAIENLMSKIFTDFPIQACIVNVTPSFMIIDIGTSAGIEIGMEFEVYQVTVLRGPTGEITWRDETFIGRVRTTDVQLNSSKVEILSGGNFQVGDICKLPEEIESD